MKLIRNLTHEPIRVPLAGGRVLHLGPAKTGQVADEAVERAAFRKLLDAGSIEIVGEGTAAAATGTTSQPREATHGHHPPTVVLPKGNR